MEEDANQMKVSPGTASIKTQYIAVDHVRQLNLDFVTKEDKSKVSKRTEKDEHPAEPRKKKLRGQNKNRPRNTRTPRSEKLCFSFADGSCPHGTNCAYSHDIDAYMAKKPPDLGESCYLFETFGKCQYGFSCRFSAKHIINGKNVCNENLWGKTNDKQTTVNALSRDLMYSLRKRTYDFSKSNTVLKTIENGHWKENLQKSKLDQELCDSSVGKNCVPSDVPHTCEELLPPKTVSEETLNNVLELKSEENKVSVVPEDSKRLGVSSDEDIIRLKPCEVKKVDFRDKLYLAPLTTVGNLPFRRICKEFGADITCGEMAIATSLLQAQVSEWALLKRHHTEDIFGVQICGAHPDVMTRCCQLLNEKVSVDFIDVNMGCPLEFIYRKGSGSGLMTRLKKLEEIIYGMASVSDVPITLKMRTGVYGDTKIAHNVINKISYLKDYISLFTVHGRSREQRYTKSADWDYIKLCSEASHPVPFFGNGDVLSYEDYNFYRKEANVQGIMIARGALMKPWIFTEIKEQRHWDISSSERFDFIKTYVNYGLEHWGSDSEGVEKTRRFLLEWLSFLYRYIPVGLLERVPQRINERPPPYFGRNDLETLMASPSCADWIKISEMLLGPVPENFSFLPKHKANAYS